MSGSTPIKAFLEGWMVESGDFPELQVGQVAEMALCAHVRALDGVGEVPVSARVYTGALTQEIEGVVTWVRHDKQGLPSSCNTRAPWWRRTRRTSRVRSDDLPGAIACAADGALRSSCPCWCLSLTSDRL